MPKVRREIILYSCCQIGINYNCFAKCQNCKAEYPMPEAELKTYDGAKIYSASIRKAERLWNERANQESNNI